MAFFAFLGPLLGSGGAATAGGAAAGAGTAATAATAGATAAGASAAGAAGAAGATAATGAAAGSAGGLSGLLGSSGAATAGTGASGSTLAMLQNGVLPSVMKGVGVEGVKAPLMGAINPVAAVQKLPMAQQLWKAVGQGASILNDTADFLSDGPVTKAANKLNSKMGLDQTKGVGNLIKNAGEMVDGELANPTPTEDAPHISPDPGMPTGQGRQPAQAGPLSSPVQVRPFSEYFQEALNGF